MEVGGRARGERDCERMMVALFLDDLFRSTEFSEEVLARDYRLLTQIAGAVEDLVDVEVHLK